MTYFTEKTPPEQLVAQLRSARRVAVLTGAGVSAESGIPTFRDAQNGVWSRFDVSRLATPEGFSRDPARVWAWYESRRLAALHASPNPGHMALARMAQLPWLEAVAVITQNVDDLHERAGSRNVMHLHGSLFAPRCSGCGVPWQALPAERAVQPPASAAADESEERLPPPRCLRCGDAVRPGVVWFGEGLPDAVWLDAMRVVTSADLMLVIGTSASVHPAASLPGAALRQGCKIWVVNPDPGASAHTDHPHWLVHAGAGLPALVRLAA